MIILGAGLSGLHAARLLQAEGAKVLILESAPRAGGRMQTLDDLPGRPEAGGQQVGQTYARIRRTASDLGVGIVPYPPVADRSRALALAGEVLHESDWAASPRNPFPDPFKPAAPDRALFMGAARANPFADNYAWREATPDQDISADAFLQSLGFDARSRLLVDHALNANRLDTYAMANVWRSLTLYAEDSALGPAEEIEGGSSRLVEAMAASLGDAVRTNTPVLAVEADETGARVRTSDEALRADFVIATAAFPALRRISLDAPLTPLQSEAIQGLPYTRVLQIHLAVENRFWDADGLPAAMWTDTPIERVFPVRDRNAGEVIGLTCWINGDGAAPGASEEDWFSLAATILGELRGAQVRPLKIVRWDENSQPGGAYMHWAPGQIADWAGGMGAPAGRLHFAGEHLSFLHTGMEGAMEAGERAAFEILEAIRA